MNIFKEAPKFALLVHKNDEDLKEVLPNYQFAVKAIHDLIENKYLSKYFNDGPDRGQRLRTGREKQSAPAAPNPSNSVGVKNDVFHKQIIQWTDEMAEFGDLKIPTVSSAQH